jgi:predicted ferric reductase
VEICGICITAVSLAGELSQAVSQYDKTAGFHPGHHLLLLDSLLVGLNRVTDLANPMLMLSSLVGIVYKTWITPVKKSDKFNTRTGLGGFSDRVGALAYALTPLTVAMCSRDSILSLLTSIPYQNFNFLHRWTGRIILVQSFLHTISWTIVEGRLYQPQPKVYVEWIKQPYMVWGIVAQGFITFLFVFSLRPVIRWTGYEFFRKTHLLVAGLYLGACWGHWSKLACWMIASLGILGIDLSLRIVRVCLIHVGYKDGNKGIGFRSVPSKVESFKDPTGTIIRLSFTHNHEPWKIGQHFYLTFPSLNIWQSHPFTPASVPSSSLVPSTHTYIVRARKGETGRLAAICDEATGSKDSSVEVPVILMGPYGGSIIDREASNMLAIAGGTGVSFTLPAVMAALADPSHPAQNIELVWIIRHVENLAWIAPELQFLKSRLSQPSTPTIEDEKDHTIVRTTGSKYLRIRIFVSRAPETRTQLHTQAGHEKDVEISSVSSAESMPTHSHEVQELLQPHPDFIVTYLDHQHPNAFSIVDTFIDETVSSGRTQVLASGPAALGTDIRAAVAARNSAGGVWRGDERGDVDCVWDDRLA